MVPSLSIIIPVYKIEQYLGECIESVLNQSFEDFELILVDDGSPDNCGKICNEYARNDSRVKVIHQKNRGVNVARNNGLCIASGKYIMFVDGDDRIKSNTLQVVLECMEQNSEVDLLQFPEIHVCGDKEILWHGYFVGNRVIKDKKEMIRALIGSDPTIPGGLYGKVYRREIWQNLRLREDMQFCEDMIILPTIMERCRQVMTIFTGAYYYIDRSGSAMRSLYTSKKCLDVSRLKMHLFEVSFQYDIETGRWWNNALFSVINAWTMFGPCAELKAALKQLKETKNSVGYTKSSKRIVEIGRWFTPLFAAILNRVIVLLRKRLNNNNVI